MTFKEIIDQRKKFFESAGQLFKNQVETLFELVPELAFIQWTQSTPVFNDGDVCEFGVSSLDYFLNNGNELDEDDFDEENYQSFCYYSIENQRGLSDNSKKCLIDFDNEFKQIDEDVFKDLFGDGKKITVKRDGTVKIEDFEDY